MIILFARDSLLMISSDSFYAVTCTVSFDSCSDPVMQVRSVYLLMKKLRLHSAKNLLSHLTCCKSLIWSSKHSELPSVCSPHSTQGNLYFES